jgi:3-deoxy-7-phosphoheptulonate synthase
VELLELQNATQTVVKDAADGKSIATSTIPPEGDKLVVETPSLAHSVTTENSTEDEGSVASRALTPLSQRPSVSLWRTHSFEALPAAQPITYPCKTCLSSVLTTLSTLPHLVPASTIESARAAVIAASKGRAFLLQGGDCSESFADVKRDVVSAKVALLSAQTSFLKQASKLRGVDVVKFGRIAGQYSKPRSALLEALPHPDNELKKVHAFRGENVNAPHLDEDARTPDPARLLKGWELAQQTLGWIEDLRAESQDTDDVLFTAHEALHLPYEAALTHVLEPNAHDVHPKAYNHSAAFVWTGERTRQLDGAHLEYLRGLRNPIGVKVGPTTRPDELVKILEKLCENHQDSLGEEREDHPSRRICLITRLGADNVAAVLPPLVKAVQATGALHPVWICDPCHGNTISVSVRDGSGQGTVAIKTRLVPRIIKEITETAAVLEANGAGLGGLHLEQTGEMVSECLDEGFDDNDGEGRAKGIELEKYKSLCDPRLNREQALRVVREFVAFWGSL